MIIIISLALPFIADKMKGRVAICPQDFRTLSLSRVDREYFFRFGERDRYGEYPEVLRVAGKWTRKRWPREESVFMARGYLEDPSSILPGNRREGRGPEGEDQDERREEMVTPGNILCRLSGYQRYLRPENHRREIAASFPDILRALPDRRGKIRALGCGDSGIL